MQMPSNAERMLLNLNTERVEVPHVIDFINHIVYNRPKSEKTAAQSSYATAIKTSKMGKKFNDTRRIPPTESALKMKIMRANFVTLGIC